ncbi:MAG: SdpI family protein [Lentisphaeria bacterium]|nr:SdpI family protein [Lentisphaerota bacterium]MBQ9771301.1 SdpI family protein [Lentisphaeria bacterium]
MNAELLLRCCYIFMGLIIVLVGIVMPKSKPNRWIGFRLKCTMEDPVLWSQVHRVSGPVWVIGGCLIIINTAFLPIELVIPALLGMIFLLCIISLVHIRILLRRKLTLKER